MSERTCAECGGKGAISYVEREPDDHWTPIGNGLEIGPATVHGTRLCECRRSLPAREGEARWWTTESITVAQIQFELFNEQAVVSLDPEVPVSDDNYVVERRGNRYWPTSVKLHVTSAELNWLRPDEARTLAAALVEAADKADAIDKPCVDDCGHWFPCNCPVPVAGGPGDTT